MYNLDCHAKYGTDRVLERALLLGLHARLGLRACLVLLSAAAVAAAAAATVML